MPLHPFQSRRKRLENALTLSLLGTAVVGVFFGLAYAAGGELDWTAHLGTIGMHLVLIPVGMVALVKYVRGSKAQ
jgi:hypothetical protein